MKLGRRSLFLAALFFGAVVHAEPLDGLVLSLGPVGAAVRVRDQWTSAAGAEASLLRIRERDLPAAVGVSFGGLGYTDRRGGRFWLEAEAGINAPMVFGLALGTTADVQPDGRFRVGAQATLWILAGVVPYARIGTIAELGPFVEAGIMIKLPVRISTF